MAKKKLVRPNLSIKDPVLKKNLKAVKGWNLYKDGISYSLLSKFIVCRERFRLRVVERLTHSGKKEAMEFGTIFHKGLELHAQGKSQSQIMAYFRTKSRARRKGKKTVEYDPLLCRIVASMLPLYVDFWKEVLPTHDYFETEQVFRIPFQTSIGKVVPINGKRDEGFRKNGKIWLQENKTKSRINETVILETLAFDLQSMIYLCSFQHDHPKEEIGGILYNVIRKPGMKQKQKESDKEYVERIVEDIRKQPEHYFKMFEVEISKESIELWKTRYLDPLLCQLSLWWESIKHNPFQPWTTPAGRRVGPKGKSLPEELVPNPHHFLRPFGVFDPMSQGVGDYFGRIVHNTDVGLQIEDELFPELQPDD